MSVDRAGVDRAGIDRAGIVERDKRFVWHPYTPMGRYIERTEPLVIERAQGARLYDLDGKSYLDGNASWWVALLGHGHPRLLARLQQQAQNLCHVALAGITHEPAALLAEELCRVAPKGLCKVFYSDDGSTAVEVALKACLQFWAQNSRPNRRRFVALDSAFHGETLAETALGGVSVFRQMLNSVLIDVVHVPPGNDGHQQAFDVITQLLDEASDEIAAVVVEPMVQGAGGMRFYDAAYLRHLRAVTQKHDVLLLVDEVFTGYGRTGPMWACEHAGIEPDLLCTAKGFTAGILPMAATLMTQRIFDGFLGDDERALYYGHTYCGHPLGAAIAREVLAIYRDEAILAQAQVKAQQLQAGVQRLGALPGVHNARALGMIAAVNLGSDQGSYLDRLGWLVYEEALRRGAYLRPLGNVVYFAPPLNIASEELASLLDIGFEAVAAALAKSR